LINLYFSRCIKKLYPQMKKSLTKLLFAALTLLFLNNNFAATFTVTNTNNSGAGSLRQAIIDANAFAGADVIIFSIGSGAQTITLASFVNVTTPMLIDGTSQPGFLGAPLISIAGSSMFQVNGASANGTTVQYLNFSGIAGSTGIIANSVSNCLFDNLLMTGLSTAIRFDGSSNTNTITNCNMSNCTGYALWLNNGSNNGFTINNNNISNGANFALYYSYGTPASVNGNTFTGSQSAWYQSNATNFTITPPAGAGPNLNTYGGHSGQVLFINNGNSVTVNGWDFNPLMNLPLSNKTPIIVANTTNSSFNNNIATGMSTAIRFDGSGSNNSVSNGNYNGCQGYAVWLNSGSFNGFTINSNTLTNCASWALYYYYGTPASVNGNTFTGSQSAWYQSNATNFTITAPTSVGPNLNVYGGHTGQVLYLNNGNNNVVNGWDFNPLMVLPLNNKTPIIVANTSNSSFNNNIATGMSTAIRFDGSGSNNSVSNGNYNGCQGYAVWLNSGSFNGFTINSNTLTNCASWALYYYYGTPASVNGNTFTGSQSAWYQSNATNFTITAPTSVGPNLNVYGGHTGQVLYLNNGNNNVVNGWDFNPLMNLPLNNKTPIIVANTSNSSFNNNIATGMSTAIRFDGSGSNNSVSNGNYNGCQGYAVWLNSGSFNGFTINSNTLTNCASWALYYYYGTPASVNGNTFTGSQSAWYQSNASNFTITAPTSVGPNLNVYGGHVGQVLMLNNGNNVNVSGWNFNPLMSLPLNTKTPFIVSSTSSSIFNNNIATGMNTGIRFDGGGSNNTINNGNYSNSANMGIWLNNASFNSFTISANTLTNCLGTALSYNYGTPGSINSNTFTGSANAFYLRASGAHTLGSNVYAGQTGMSIHLEGCNNVNVSNANTPGTGGHGVYMNSCNTCSIINNSSCGRQFGIRLVNSCNTNSISGGNLGTATVGIQLESASVNNTTINAVNFYGNATNINNSGINTVITATTNNNFTPTVTVNSGSICSGQSFTMVPSGALTYTFQGGSAVVSPTANATYTVIGSDAMGCVSVPSATSSVIVNAIPTISVNSGAICSGQSFTMLPSGANTYTFEGGNAVVSPTANTNYTVTGTSTAGCLGSNTATSNVTVNANPTITVNSGAICSGQSFTMIPGGANTYTFEGGNAVVSPTANTNYTVVGTGTNGCVSALAGISSVTVNANPVISVNSGSICSGQSFTMIPGGANTYTFEGGNAVVSPTANTNYTVTGTSTAGCLGSNTATAAIIVNANPTITVNSGSICSGQSFTMVAGGANTYTFEGGNAVVSPTANTNYTVVGTSIDGCAGTNTAVASLTVNANPTITAASGAICTGSSYTINPTGGNTYTVSGGNTVVSPTVTTSYTVTGTSIEGCAGNSAVVTVSVQTSLTVSITGSNTVCSGQSLNFTAGGAATYTWNTGAVTNTIAPTPTANTTYSVIGASGLCSSTAVVNVTVNALPTLSVTGNNTLCVGESVTLTVSGADTYSWNTGPTTTNVVVTPTTSTVYTTTGTSSLTGCSNTSTFSVTVDLCTGIASANTGAKNEIYVFPNPFTNKITLVNTSAVDSDVQIFNTLGSLIYSAELKGDKIEIDLTGHANGVYFLRSGSFIKRIIKD